jgi:hypothetical protein
LKKIAWWTLWAALAVVGVIAANYAIKIVLFGMPITEDEVRARVAAANYCTVAADCVAAPGDCPFVSEAVNVKEQQKVADLYTRHRVWNGVCMYSMLDTRDFDRMSCKLRTCVVAIKGK